MKDQINTIRDALAFLDARFGWSPGEAPAIDTLRAALPELESHLAQYEAGDVASAAAQGFRDGVASVTQQEPVAWAMPKGDGTFIDVITPAEHARDEGSYTVPLFAHPVAQQPQAKPHKPLFADLIAQHPGLREELLEMDKQPQARPDFTDEWTGYLKDGETPFERFLRERKDLTALTKLYQRALEENESLKAQQPQAEAVPPDVVRDAARYRWLRDQTTDDGIAIVMKNKYINDSISYAENINKHIDAAIAQQKGGV